MRTFVAFALFTLLTFSVCIVTQSAGAQGTAKQSTTYRLRDDGPTETGPHYARARELYDLGPTKAEEIIAELDLALRQYPDSLKALSLKANTQIGTGQFQAALATLDRYDEVTRKDNSISPTGILLRARCLYYMGDYKTAKQTLEPFWAFFQQDDNSKSRYDSLMAAIAAKLPATNAR